MYSITELIALIEKKPAMYLGKPHISLLRAYLDGWAFALHQATIEATGWETMSKFQEWIAQKYRSTTTHGWHQIILYYSEDERTALATFFELFNEFLTRTKK